VLAKRTLKVSHVSLGVGKLTHVVRGASEGGYTLVAREGLAQPTLHPIPPSLIKASCTLLRHAFLRSRRTTLRSAASDYQQRAVNEGAPAPQLHGVPGSSGTLRPGTREPGIRMTMPVYDANDADGARKDSVVHGVRKAPKHDAAQATMHHGKSLGVVHNFAECIIDDRKEVRSRLW